MGYGTASVAAATTPTVISVFFSHFLRHRKSRKGTATSELSYDEGVAIIRKFLDFAAKHSVEELQAFTKAKVPVPTWVDRKTVEIQSTHLDKAATILRQQFEPDGGTEHIGGVRWWTVRDAELQGEWLEMVQDRMKRVERRKQAVNGLSNVAAQADPDRVILYVHGGAYFFSSLETHRYQIQRHARKLGGRTFSPSYRLAPQYPFPCGLLDCLAAYLYLIDQVHLDPSQIVFSGDSAGAGMVLALLCVLRDQGLPLPAGASLISPWVDLTHSFPSVMRNAASDYIPGAGFHFQPSDSWPPLKSTPLILQQASGPDLIVEDQIQQYVDNSLLDHPLVSPVNQGSLGGLPPLFIAGGSGELLCDEIIYTAHKAANPALYAPSDIVLDRYPSQRAKIAQYPPTKVHLAIFDDCSHVVTTLSFTKPAKYMYRAVANFNLWSIQAAHKRSTKRQRYHDRTKSNGPSRGSTLDSQGSQLYGSFRGSAADSQDALHSDGNNLPDDFDAGSEDSSSSDDNERAGIDPNSLFTSTGAEPSFGPSSMIRERVSIHGVRRPMEPESELAALQMPREHVGSVSARGPINKWLQRRAEWDLKFSKQHAAFRVQKAEDYKKASASGWLTHEKPPLCALAAWHDVSRARACASAQHITKSNKQLAMGLWARLSAMPDEEEAGNAQVEELARSLEEQGVRQD